MIFDTILIDDITVIIPTLNEEEAIGLVLEDVMLHGYEKIIVVDGDSSDGTVDIVNGYNVDLIKQKKGKGKTGAIVTAINHIRTPYFVLMDGDCTYSAKDIENLIAEIGQNYEIIGVREKGRENISLLNRLGNWIINQLFNLIFATRLTDVCSGMYILKTDFARSLSLYSEGFDVEVELAANAARTGRVSEAKINYYPRLGVQKLHPFRDGARIIYRILLLGLRFYPARFCSLVSIFLAFPGLALMISSFSINFLAFQLQSSFLGLILVVCAMQGATLFLVDQRIQNIYRNRENSNNY